ncbi:hypothetical protein JL107_07100 [Nakamurella flavida]|uniref:Uncharacterized protein n=1 Tax=Nakamurella flavida TaxID=363630 RepID=A0A938YK66_9ACTN|nr:hypothetical protein [Nakamurella flavida]MBM9476208.1 hypothetical protein [Nakamurella flavida]MDP9779694.1 hypothetical protein [Nakamurella flavida]
MDVNSTNTQDGSTEMTLQPPRLTPAGLWWWGLGLTAVAIAMSWLYFPVVDTLPRSTQAYAFLTQAYLSPLLTVGLLVGPILIAAGLVLRAVLPAERSPRPSDEDRLPTVF